LFTKHSYLNAVFFICFVIATASYSWGSDNPFPKTIEKLRALRLPVAVLIRSKGVSMPHWSDGGQAIDIKVEGEWKRIKLEKLRFVRQKWNNELPIALNVAEEAYSTTPKKKQVEYEQNAYVRSDRVRGLQTDVEWFLEDSGFSSDLRVRHQGSPPRHVWSTPHEISHSLALSPDESMVIFIAEHTGLLLAESP